MLGGPPLDVVPEPDLAHVETGDGLGEALGPDELLDALAAEVAEEPGDFGGADEVVGTGTGGHLTTAERCANVHV